MRFDYRKYHKAILATLGAALFAASEAYADNPWVQAALAVAAIFGIYQVPNAPDARQG